MEIKNIQEYINNYEINNYINTCDFILTILSQFSNNNKIENIFSVDNNLIITLSFGTISIKNYQNKEEILDIIAKYYTINKYHLKILV